MISFQFEAQEPGESISTYLAELRALAQYCNYEALLKDMLRDRLVVGINDSALQKKLLAEPLLSLKKATEIALAHETAAKDSKAIQGTSGELQTVNHMVDMKPHLVSSTKPCYCHKAMECHYKETTCSYCKKKGHLAKVCHNLTSIKPSTSKQKRQATHLVEVTEPDQQESEYTLFAVNSTNCMDSNGVILICLESICQSTNNWLVCKLIQGQQFQLCLRQPINSFGHRRTALP